MRGDPAPLREQTITVDERPVRVEFRNRGAPSAIVFIHGFLGRADTTWGGFPSLLCAESGLLDWDVYGVGYSSSLRLDVAGISADNAPLEVLGYYLRTTLNHLPFADYRRLALIAHSMGGLISQQALLDSPTRARVSHLFLFGTPSGGTRRARFARRLHAQARDMAEGSQFITNLRAAWAEIQSAEPALHIRVVAAERDVFVPPHSSLGPFAEASRFVIPGSHNGMVKPKDAGSLAVQLVIAGLLGRDVSFALRRTGTESPTFLFTDVEESTRRWESYPEEMTAALLCQQTIIRNAIADRGGHVFKLVSDKICSAFDKPQNAIAAAIDAQRELAATDFSAVDGLAVRMAVHQGSAQERNGDFYGAAINRISRILPIGYGGQIIVSAVAAELARPSLPSEFSLNYLGRHRLRDLADPEEIYQIDAPTLRHAFPALRSLDAKPNNLPEETNAFIGRENELLEVGALIRDSRLVTLIGAGGIGKTRLSLHASVELLDRFSSGIWFVELGGLGDPALIWSSAAAAMGLTDATQRTAERVISHIKNGSVLVIFDNCEHVIDRVAGVVSEILQKCAKVHVLCTSREALRVAGERIYRMPSLPTALTASSLNAHTAMAFGSIALFVDRARSAQPEFQLTDKNVATVAAICRRLDGIALAVELTAARVGSMPLTTLAEHVQHRMLALTRGARDAAPRQQTMRSMIDWSYLLLSGEERAAFVNLSIFAGGFTLEAGAWLSCRSQPALDEFEAFNLITALVDKSLIVLETRSEPPRYRLLEPIREFAREKLISAGEFDRIAGLHAQYFRNLIESIDRVYWQGDEQPFDPFAELGNLRAALHWALAERHDVVTGAATAASLMGFWFVAGDEGRRWADLARAQLPAGIEPEIDARLNLGVVQLELGSPAEMRCAAEAAIRYYREHDNASKLAESLYFASMTIALYFPEDRELADLLASEAIAVAESIKAKWMLILALRAKAVAIDPADGDGRIAAMSQSLDLAREYGANARLIAALQMQLAELEFERGRYDTAIDYGLEALRESERAGHTRAHIFLHANLAHYAAMIGDSQRAHRWAYEALNGALESQDAYSTTVALNALAAVEAIEGNAASAATLFGFCNERFGRLHPARQDRSCEETVYRFMYVRLAGSLGEDRLLQLLKHGGSFSLDRALSALGSRE